MRFARDDLSETGGWKTEVANAERIVYGNDERSRRYIDIANKNAPSGTSSFQFQSCVSS